MSPDGTTIISQNQTTLRYSTDDGDTWTAATTFTGDALPIIVSGQFLANGEVVVATKPADNGEGFSLWLSDGWASDPTTATWSKVHTGGTAGAYPAAFSWSVHGTRVLVSEYGPKRSSGTGVNARYAYMSDDNGQTWSTIYDLGDGDGVHLHGICYDPVWDRIWICYGDDNSGIIYSDDDGDTWKVAQSTTDVNGRYQVTAIHSLDDCILFGSDGDPNGVVRISRSQGKNTADGSYDLETAYLHNDVTQITHVSQTTYQRAAGDLVVMYYAPGVTDGKAFVLVTRDGESFTKVWEDSIDTPAGHNGNAFGPTADGNMLITQPDGRYGSGRSWWRGPMPSL